MEWILIVLLGAAALLGAAVVVVFVGGWALVIAINVYAVIRSWLLDHRVTASGGAAKD